jgi:hypothetical protein
MQIRGIREIRGLERRAAHELDLPRGGGGERNVGASVMLSA